MADQKKSAAQMSLEELKKQKKKRMVIVLVSMCVIAAFGMFFLESDLSFDLFSSDTEVVQDVYLHDPDWDTNIFELQDYLDKNRLLTYAENGMATSLDGDYDNYGDSIQMFADYFDALMRGDAETVCAFYADSYFETHDRWEKITMQKIYDMRVEYLKNADVTVGGKTVTNWYYKVAYKIMENDGTFRNDVPSDGERAQYYVVTDDGYSLKITDVGYAYQGNL